MINNKLNLIRNFFLGMLFVFLSTKTRGIKRYKNRKKNRKQMLIDKKIPTHDKRLIDKISMATPVATPAMPNLPVEKSAQYHNRKDKQKTNVPFKGDQKNGHLSISSVDSTNNNKSDNDQNKEERENENEEVIELNFENADLQNFIKQVAYIFDVTFIPDDAVQPLAAGRKQIKGNKISFKTQKPLSKKNVWDLFITFLGIAGFTIVPQADPRTYLITTIPTARKSPITAYIGVDYAMLPENDEIVRYVYFIQNSSVDSIKNVIDSLRSNASSLVVLKEHKAFILTDKAYNIRTLMEIVKELDKVSMPQSMSILKLRRADAKQVKELYDSLIQPSDRGTPRFFSKKQPTSLFFPENTRIIVEPRTNALILLGPKNALQKIENFIIKNIDVELDQPYSPLYSYQLKYADAVTVADIMNNVTQYGKDIEVGKSGGVRGVDKYLRPMAFVPEKETNRLIIKGYYEDYLKAKVIIEKLDEAQPQIAIEVLILAISAVDAKELGAQLRSKSPGGPDGLIGQNVEFQTSGLFGGASKIVENENATSGVDRLLGDILKVVVGAQAGNTILALGQDKFGVWGVFQALQTFTNAEIISNPFLIATNKTPATVYLGEERRIKTATIVGTSEVDSFGSDEAKLEVKLTPQINSDGMIVLDLVITINDFSDSVNLESATKNIREIKTATIVANNEVLALGGLIRNRITRNQTKTPLLGDVPLLGWFFKNQSKVEQKQNLLILISSRIIEPSTEKIAHEFTEERIADYYGTIDSMKHDTQKQDPIHKLFFDSGERQHEQTVEDLLLGRNGKEERRSTKKKLAKNKRRRRRSKKRKKDSFKPQVPNEGKPKGLPESVPDNLLLTDSDEKLREKIKNKKKRKLSVTDFLPFNDDELRV